jgi:TctA family transporter
LKSWIDHYFGGLMTILVGIGLTAFGVWERLPGEARSAFVMGGISVVAVGVGVFNVERKQRRMESKIDSNTQITANAAAVAAVHAEQAVVHAEDAAQKAEVAASEAAQSRRMG